MKKLIFLAVALILIATSCKKDEKSPTPVTPVTASGMTAWETSLVGNWKLKRTEWIWENFYLTYGGDSIAKYVNHYNYFNSLLDLTTSPITLLGIPMYVGSFGVEDATPPNLIYWYGGAGTISIQGTPNMFVVKYLTPDSMMLEVGSGTSFTRLYYNKTTTPPVLNNIESQLVGGTWTLSTVNGAAPPLATQVEYLSFASTYFTDGYRCKDSVANSPLQFWTAWQVLQPAGPVPKLRLETPLKGLYTGTWMYNISSVTATTLTLNGGSASVLVFTR